jgi:hypothetical protein
VSCPGPHANALVAAKANIASIIARQPVVTTAMDAEAPFRDPLLVCISDFI